MNQPTPIRHGDWRMIDGQLVDFSQVQPAPATPPAPSPEQASNPAPRARTRSKKR